VGEQARAILGQTKKKEEDGPDKKQIKHERTIAGSGWREAQKKEAWFNVRLAVI